MPRCQSPLGSIGRPTVVCVGRRVDRRPSDLRAQSGVQSSEMQSGEAAVQCARGVGRGAIVGVRPPL